MPNIMQEFKTLFTVRSMAMAVEQLKTPQTFLLNHFFGRSEEHNTRAVEINFRDGKRRIAPFVHRRSTGQKVENLKDEKFIWEPPYIKPRIDIEPSDLQEAALSENPYSLSDPAERFIEKRNQILRELDDMITRREEVMAAQALFSKSISVTNEDGSTLGSIDFVRSADLAFQANPLWNNASTAQPITDVRTMRTRIRKLSGAAGRTVVMGTLAADAFLLTDQVKQYLDAQAFSVSELQLSQFGNFEGVELIAVIGGVTYLRYDEFYEDANGVLQPVVPEKLVLVGSPDAAAMRHYGAIETIATASGLVRAARWPKFFDAADKDPEVYGVQLHSAPLPVTHQPNAYGVITALT